MLNEMQVLDKIIEISKALDEIDNFDKNVPEKMIEYNYKLSDLYHYIENNTLDSKKCYRICREFKKVLKKRRDFKNNVELLNEYKQLKLKLNSGIENRQMLLSSLGKRSKRLNQPYKNRIYTDEELKKIMED